MATTHTDTNVNQLVINKMTKQEYDNLSQVSSTELYLVEEQVDSVVTQNSTNPVQSGAVYEALQQSSSNINDGTTLFTKNNKTIGTISANQALDKTIKIPNDIIMCKMSDGLVYDSYITYTKVKQYLPDYPYYSDDLNWEIGGNPPTRANITADNYYLDVDTKHIFVADENLELLDITSSVVIHGDPNKLYCNVDTNILYRYDGTNFVALTSNFSGDYNDLINKPDLNFLKQRDLATYQGENDEIVQHIGSTDINFTNGYIYKNKNVHTLTYYNEDTQSYNTYSYYGETLDNVTFELFKVTQDNINYVIPTNAGIGDNFWVVDNFNDLNVIHVFIIDDCGEDTEGTIDYTGHFLATNITLTINVPYQYVSVTSKASIYKNGNKYLYCPTNDFKYLSKSISNNKARCIPPTITVNDFYKWQLNNVQPNQLSLENSKVKYTLSDGTTKLTLAQESDLNFKDNIGGLNLLQNSGTFLGKWVTNVNSPIYNASEVTPSGTYQGNRYINVTMAWSGVSMPINCKGSTTYTHSVFLRTNNDTWVIGYVAEFDGTVWSSTLLTNAIQLTTSFKRYSLTYTTKATTQQVMLIFECTSNGSVDFCMPKTEEGSVATDWSPNPQDFRNTPVEFTSAAVSGNIASGETLAVMMKKIYNCLTLNIFTRITSGSLNDYLNSGYYFALGGSEGSTDAANITGKPTAVGGGFLMEVKRYENYAYQHFIHYNGNEFSRMVFDIESNIVYGAWKTLTNIN